MKPVYFFSAALLLLALAALSFSDRARPDDPFREAQTAIAVRLAGHRLLQAAGDSGSTLPPVREPAPGVYRLSFPVALSFQPDSLVAIVGRALDAAGVRADYVVTMREPSSDAVVFGFAVWQQNRQRLVPCSGRAQGAARYEIEVQLQRPASRTGALWTVGAGTCALALLILGFFRARRTDRPLPAAAMPPPSSPDFVPLGQYRFAPGQQCLYFYGERLPLTGKESAVLGLLLQQPNELVERSALQKIWDDEGVIVGRSLDVFVSRLRKKLERDPSIAIVSVTGKGYRLEVTS